MIIKLVVITRMKKTYMGDVHVAILPVRNAMVQVIKTVKNAITISLCLIKCVCHFVG